MSDSARESVAHAIELMSAWLECSDESVEPLSARLQRIISEPREGGDHLSGAVELILGMTYLNGSLLFLVEEKTGIPARETLQELALQYARASAPE